jgi:hypothetical protein
VVTLDHNPFEYQTTYTISVTAEDLAGNVLSGAPYTWSFTTMPQQEPQRTYLPIVHKNYPAATVNSARRDRPGHHKTRPPATRRGA